MAKDKLRNPTHRCAELLGLETYTQLPPASRVRLSRHAVERFVERVRPGAPAEQARRELLSLMRGARVRRHRPGWVAVPRDFVVEEAAGYVVIDEPTQLALPIQWTDGVPLAVTCLVPGA